MVNGCLEIMGMVQHSTVLAYTYESLLDHCLYLRVFLVDGSLLRVMVFIKRILGNP